MTDRKKQLEQIFNSIDDNERELIEPLLEDVVFLEDKMRELRKLPFVAVHPQNNTMQKKTEVAKLYKECSQSYQNAIRILVGILHKVDKDAENELLNKLSEFE